MLCTYRFESHYLKRPRIGCARLKCGPQTEAKSHIQSVPEGAVHIAETFLTRFCVYGQGELV